jgi:nucleoporin NUP159
VQEEVEADIEASKLHDVDTTMAELTRVRKGMGELLREGQALKKKLEQLRDPKRRKSMREAPLEEPMANEQRRMREGFARYQKLLVEAEEAVTVLRARIAAVQGKRDEKKVPTVEAVENTIRKMTAMAQERSAEVDVLERSMRKLGIAPSTPSRDSPTRPMTRDSMRSSTPLRGSWLAASVQKQTPTKTGMTFKTPGYENDEDGDEVEDDEEDLVEAERRKQWEEKVRKYKEKRERRKIALGHFRDAVLKKHAAEMEAKSKAKTTAAAKSGDVNANAGVQIKAEPE